MARKSSFASFGKVVQGFLGIVAILLGATTTMSGAGAIIGVPMALLGVALVADAFHVKVKL
jgi:hypothetical protein